jgi:hypothetical protein
MSDINNNPLPAGATLDGKFECDLHERYGRDGKGDSFLPAGSDKVSNTNAPGGTFHAFIVEGSKCTTRLDRLDRHHRDFSEWERKRRQPYD